ncbi:MAG: hypothetical protein A2046_15760 [Bacteroidetes bacterium GWA2_30_7]|nr:MAG: hypothetical protein A2046_15760 [Bacteroidetes bacterium GWA2_30_7]
MAKGKRHKLKLESEFNFSIYGIYSSEKDYKLCWLINEKLSLKLSKSEDIIFESKNGMTNNFSVYSHFNENEEILYRLISNKNLSYYLIEELKNIDFVFQIFNNDDILKITTELKKVENILGVIKIDLELIKSISKQVLEI